MGILKSAIVGKSKAVDLSRTDLVGWHGIGGLNNTYGFYKNQDYENAYPSINAIAKRFFQIIPYAIDENGKRQKENKIIDALSHPNTAMSGLTFREALAVMALTHDKVYVRVHRKGEGNITPNNITGFTFLEGVSEWFVGGKWHYSTLETGQLDESEVAVFKNINPYDLSEGYAPTTAARRWTKIDDYIADYEAGFFENGAVPAGQFVVTAASVTDYNDIVDAMKRKHQGAGKNNNVAYAHRPIDNATGKPVQNAGIEWVPFATNNKDHDLKSLFEQVNMKIDSVYTVPASIRGVNDSNTYASVRVDQAIFVDETIRPFTMKIWAQFTHELNRITGGIGVAITFDLETPNIAEEDKLVAERKQIDASNITTLLAKGYTLDSIIKAYDYPDEYNELRLDPNFQAPPTGSTTGTGGVDNPDVDNGDEVNDSPTGEDKKKIVPLAKAVSVNDFPGLLEGLGLDVADLGCVMLDTEKLDILSFVEDGEADLVYSTDRHDHAMGAVAEREPHITLLFGLLENANTIKDKVDQVLEGWDMSTAIIDHVGSFETDDSFAIVAHIQETPELLDGHDRLTLLPHVNTFSEYKPHMTLAYVKKEANVSKWIASLNAKYAGRELSILGLNYGDMPEEKSKAISPAQRVDFEQRAEIVIRNHMRVQIERTITGLEEKSKAVGDASAAEDAIFAEQFYAVVRPLMLAQGSATQTELLQIILMAGLDASSVTGFALTAEQLALYDEYLRRVAASYGEQTAESIRRVLARSAEQNLTKDQTAAALRDIMRTDDYRVIRLANSEVNRAGNTGSVNAAQNIQRQTGYKVEKVWTHGGSDSPCEFCQAMIGTVVDVDQAFVPEGGIINGVDGGIFTNNFVPMETCDAHPNCHCVETYKIGAQV